MLLLINIYGMSKNASRYSKIVFRALKRKGDVLEKRKGVALITVILLFAFTSVLAMSVLSIYMGSVKQNTKQRDYNIEEYQMYSGINIISSYIVNTNSGFLTDYNSFLEGNTREDEFVINLDSEGVPVSVSITSIKDDAGVDEFDIVDNKVTYNITSTNNDDSTKSLTRTITQINTEGDNEFILGDVA